MKKDIRLPRWRVVGMYIDPHGDTHIIPDEHNPIIVQAADRAQASEAARQELWDERLTAADCLWHAVIEYIGG